MNFYAPARAIILLASGDSLPITARIFPRNSRCAVRRAEARYPIFKRANAGKGGFLFLFSFFFSSFIAKRKCPLSSLQFTEYDFATESIGCKACTSYIFECACYMTSRKIKLLRPAFTFDNRKQQQQLSKVRATLLHSEFSYLALKIHSGEILSPVKR